MTEFYGIHTPSVNISNPSNRSSAYLGCFPIHVQSGRQNTYQSYLDFKQKYIPRGQNVLQKYLKIILNILKSSMMRNMQKCMEIMELTELLK